MNETEETPQHHFPIVHGLHLATGQEATDCYTLFWQEVSKLAARVRQRRATHGQEQANALCKHRKRLETRKARRGRHRAADD